MRWGHTRASLINFVIPGASLLLIPFSTILFSRSRPISGQISQLPNLFLPVSIIVPTLNNAGSLRRALESAVNQSLRNIEIVVVDDGSDDSSVAIAVEMHRADPRVRVFRHRASVGLNIARISAVENARGDYILSLDPNGELRPYIAEDAVHFALLHDADVIEFDALRVCERSVKLSSFLKSPSALSTGDYLVELFGNQKLNWNMWRRFVRRSVYLKALSAFPGNLKITRISHADEKLHFGSILLFTQRNYFLREVGYVYYAPDVPQPLNSEGSKELAVVEQCLGLMYRTIANANYNNRGLTVL
jgi:glycosyltransferase involved in cell wall biosynthesis